MEKSQINKYAKLFEKYINSKQIHEAVLLIEDTRGEFTFCKGYGGKDVQSPLLMASITKLFTTTCILIFLEQGKLSLDDPLAKYFDSSVLNGLHIYAGKEYSFELTVGDLLFQRSGLPDIYEEGKESVKKRFIEGDFYLPFDEIVALTKKLRPHFAPQKNSKAYYADINFDLLGEIIEKVSGLLLANAYKEYIFAPLGLKDTYLPMSENDFIPGIYYWNEQIHRPKVVMSSRASGGCISTAGELMKFMKAFFNGQLFKKGLFKELAKYQKLQAAMLPIRYGGGYMQIPLGGLATLFMGKGELLGHSGSTGSFAFYYPEEELFFVGDVNQMANAALPVRLSMQLAITSRGGRK